MAETKDETLAHSVESMKDTSIKDDVHCDWGAEGPALCASADVFLYIKGKAPKRVSVIGCNGDQSRTFRQRTRS